MANVVSERRWLVIIFALYFLLGIGYSLLMPIWEAPDEPAHYHLAWYFARNNKFPTEEFNYEVAQPHAYYYFSSFVIRGLEEIRPHYTNYFFPREFKSNIRIPEPRFDWNSKNYRFMLGVYTLRWINLILGGLALWINWRSVLRLIPESPTQRIATLTLAALTPQYIHIMSSVSNDALGVTAGASLLYLAVRTTGEKSHLSAILSLLLAILLPLITKLTVLPVSAASLAVVACMWLFNSRQKKWLVAAGLMVICAIGILHFFFPEAIEWTQREISWRLISGLRTDALTVEYIKMISNQIAWTYWGKAGWLAVGISGWAVKILTILGLVGAAIKAYTLVKQRSNHPQFHAWLAAGAIALFIILAVARNGLTTSATQGRFLFPAIGALSLLMVGGWHDVLSEGIRQKLPLMITLLMLSLNIGLWLFGVIPVYYQPFLD